MDENLKLVTFGKLVILHNGLHRTGWISTKKIAETCSSQWSYIVEEGAKIFYGYLERLKSYIASKLGKLTILLQ